MGEDRSLEVFERLAWLQPELLGKHAPRILVALEGLGLASRSVEREHQLPAQPFSQRMLGHERLQLSNEVSVTGEGKVGLDPLLQDREPQLLESHNLPLRERLVRDVGED